MNDYIETRLDFNAVPRCEGSAPDGVDLETATDVMASLLADIGFESFSPDETGMTAFVRKEDFNENALKAVLADFPFGNFTITCSCNTIEGQDWNHEWEKNYFKPIVVGDQCVIHSSFHTDIPPCTYDIVIDPKMAFGTGHHATTSLIIERLLAMDLNGESVIDMGTGTGILAILAAMRGAASVTAIEIDPAAEINARENVRLNGHAEIDVRLGDASLLAGINPAGVFIANINRNIITADIAAYATALRQGGTMLLSGFYEADIPVIMQFAAPLGLHEVGHTVKGDNWTCLELRKA